MMEFLLLLLPVAAASGWLAAKRSTNRAVSGASALDRNPAYFQGLNYLLNEQPDKAIDVFVQMLEVDSDTVETHLALGNLFRRRGEVDRAIRIHQNLIARPTLSRNQRAQALLELGQDYMRAGLFDRAESLFNELVEMNLCAEQALHNLQTIYQQEKEWNKCLTVTSRLEAVTGESLRTERAHYYCELAEEAIRARDYAHASAMLKKAQNCDRDCVRSTILQGNMERAKGECKAAIRSYKRVEQQDADFMPEVLPGLVECHNRLDRRHDLVVYLRQLFQRQKQLAPALTLLDYIREDEGEQAALEFLTRYLHEHPSLQGLNRLIELNIENMANPMPEILPFLREQVELLLKKRSSYQCGRCGFATKTLHWQCPGCNSWDSVKPI
jgi:lipopolysaccharide biosynthesis regulator YciM